MPPSLPCKLLFTELEYSVSFPVKSSFPRARVQGSAALPSPFPRTPPRPSRPRHPRPQSHATILKMIDSRLTSAAGKFKFELNRQLSSVCREKFKDSTKQTTPPAPDSRRIPPFPLEPRRRNLIGNREERLPYTVLLSELKYSNSFFAKLNKTCETLSISRLREKHFSNFKA